MKARRGGVRGAWRRWLARIAPGRLADPAAGRAPAARDPRAIGRWGEDVAARHLGRAGYRVLRRRVRIDRRHEIDLVARQGDTLVFVEVKTRASETFGLPAESVGRAKRRALSRAALRFLRRMRRVPTYIRFDIVEVVGRMDAAGPPAVRHHENAFPLESPYRYPG